MTKEMNKKLIYGVSSMMIMAGMGLTSCQSEEELAGVVGEKVLLTINASKTDNLTRTEFKDDGKGNLICNWTAGDQLLVADSKGNIGIVTLVSGEGTSEGVFKGKIELAENTTIQLWYLGNNKDEKYLKVLTTEYVLNLTSSQDGTFKSLADNDVLSAQTVVENVNGAAHATVDMTRRVAEGYFNLDLPEGVTLAQGDMVTISAESDNLYPTMKYNLTNLSTIAPKSSSITITKAEDGNDLYLTMIPTAALSPKFTINKGGYIYTATLGNHKWEAGQYVRANNNDGTFGPVKVSNWTKEAAPVNPGDLNNWGGDHTPIKMDDSGSLDRLYTSGGYVNNDYSLYINAGFCQPITFYANGMTNGYLYSTTVESPSYYQWGRWLGFPAEIGESPELNAFGQVKTDGYIWANELMVPGKLAQTTEWTYVNTQYGSIPAGQFYLLNPSTWTGGWDKEMSIKAAHMYAIKSLPNGSFCDYLKTNEQCNWEDRSGNPCPDGWRIPTIEELKVLMPSTNSVNGTFAEVKTVDGEKYAMKWVVSTNKDNLPSVKITSVKTDKSSVSSSDKIFSDSNASHLEIVAYGITSNTGKLTYEGIRAYVWSSESATSSKYSGYAGAALRIIFSGENATFGIAPQDRINGCNIIPVRDTNAKAKAIKPWFPSYWQKYI